jgi:hypothetical protein
MDLCWAHNRLAGKVDAHRLPQRGDVGERIVLDD